MNNLILLKKYLFVFLVVFVCFPMLICTAARKNTINIIFIPDINGSPGMKAVERNLESVSKKYNPDIFVINVDNTKGVGCSPEHIDMLSQLVATLPGEKKEVIFTTGNHCFADISILPYLDKTNVLRPYNLSLSHEKMLPGHGICEVITSQGDKVVISHLLGPKYMSPVYYKNIPILIGSLLDAKNDILSKYQLKINCDALFCDFHGGDAIEKQLFANSCDGKMSASIGTHTHVQTSDYRILPGGTAYCTDAGMCGDFDSIVGMRTDTAVQRFFYGDESAKISTAEGIGTFCAVLILISRDTGLTHGIYPIQINGCLPEILPDSHHKSRLYSFSKYLLYGTAGILFYESSRFLLNRFLSWRLF